MCPNRPIMISILRLAGRLACAAGAGLLVIAFWAEALRALLILSAAAAGAVGLTFLGFATNLVILHDIRSHLQSRGEK
ncbi:hypothetical protein [Microvirga arabica]|uniref:hypothetical protein n=1 Tax=Microvirga arabica TaxID=1128671 RepID=UPI003617EA51